MVFLLLLAQKSLVNADFLLSLTGLTLKVITIFSYIKLAKPFFVKIIKVKVSVNIFAVVPNPLV